MRKLFSALLLLLPLTAAAQINGIPNQQIGTGPIFWQSPGDTIASIEAECSSPCTYVVSAPQTLTLAASHTLSSNVSLEFKGGGLWTVNGAFTLTLGLVSGTPTQHFAGSSTITGLPIVVPEWFGNIATATTLPLAAAALQSGGVIQFGVGRYNSSTWTSSAPLSLSHLTLAGAGMPHPNSTATPTQLVGGTILYPTAAFSGSYLNVHDLGCDNGSATTGTAANGCDFVSYNNATTAATPGVVGQTPSASGGTLAAGNHYYRVTATTATGETSGSPEVVSTTTGSTGSVALTWTAISGATGYKVYRGTSSNGESVFYATATNSYTDTNAASTAGTVPPFNGTGATGKNLTLSNVMCLGNATSNAFHCGKVEGYNNVAANNLWSYRNEDGWVFKTTNAVISNIHGQGHLLACAYVKSETYAQAVNNSIAGVSCQPEVAGDTADAVFIQAGTDTNINTAVTNIVANGVTAAVNLSGGATANLPVQGAVVHAATVSNSTQALVVSGYISNAILSGFGITNSAGWFTETTAADSHISGLVLQGWMADAQSAAGCMNIPGEGELLPPFNVTQSGCGTIVLPAPASTRLLASGTVQTAILTSNTVYAATSFTLPTAAKIYGIQLIETNSGACSTEPVLYVYDTTANARANGTQVIFVDGTTTYNNSGSSVTVPAGDTIALEAQANATCSVTPTFVATVLYQSM